MRGQYSPSSSFSYLSNWTTAFSCSSFHPREKKLRGASKVAWEEVKEEAAEKRKRKKFHTP